MLIVVDGPERASAFLRNDGRLFDVFRDQTSELHLGSAPCPAKELALLADATRCVAPEISL
jgi:hypothetical protein